MLELLDSHTEHVLRLKGHTKGHIFYSYLDINFSGRYNMCNGVINLASSFPDKDNAEKFKSYYTEGGRYEAISLAQAKKDKRAAGMVQKFINYLGSKLYKK